MNSIQERLKHKGIAQYILKCFKHIFIFTYFLFCLIIELNEYIFTDTSVVVSSVPPVHIHA